MAFYGNIEDYKSEALLKATPYTKEVTNNFGYNLDKETFFRELYTERSSNKDFLTENEIFDKRVEYALRDLDNQYAKVTTIHIIGYAGCGKTTYIHHLLWSLRGRIGLYDVLDYEGFQRATEPFLYRIAYLFFTYNNLRDLIGYFSLISERNLYDTHRFKNEVSILPELILRLEHLLETKEYNIPESTYQRMLESMEEGKDESLFLSFLLFVELLLLLYDRFWTEEKNPMILVIDNSDSLHNLAEELSLLPVLKSFINNCNYFFGTNLRNDAKFNNRAIRSVFENTKLLMFFTTRVVTQKHYEIIEPDWERINGWTTLSLPEHYYDHKEIIDKRINYYLKQEGDSKKPIVKELRTIKSLTNVAYHNYNFMRLFNGSIRACIEKICAIVKDYPEESIREIINLNSQKANNPEAIEGCNGFFLGMVLYDFKKEGIYEAKLGLSNCQKDGKVSLSRIILTILREKGDRYSLLDIFRLLTPIGFSSEEICRCVWALCEEKREYWRRLLIFDLIIPKNINQLLQQSSQFESDDTDILHYSELVICTAGLAYMEFVVPHFEFMLSRHELGMDALGMSKYLPLFSSSSEKFYINNKGKKIYRFEQKIDWVFGDVRDCCYNSGAFSKKVMEEYGVDRSSYIRSTVFNYHSIGWDGEAGPKQSYESRLIFRHVGYIEKYRTYLLDKYYDDLEMKCEINKRIVPKIIKYLKLYQNPNKCYQTESQNRAANELMTLANKISAKIDDFNTRIELN